MAVVGIRNIIGLFKVLQEVVIQTLLANPGTAIVLGTDGISLVLEGAVVITHGGVKIPFLPVGCLRSASLFILV